MSDLTIQSSNVSEKEEIKSFPELKKKISGKLILRILLLVLSLLGIAGGVAATVIFGNVLYLLPNLIFLLIIGIVFCVDFLRIRTKEKKFVFGGSTSLISQGFFPLSEPFKRGEEEKPVIYPESRSPSVSGSNRGSSSGGSTPLIPRGFFSPSDPFNSGEEKKPDIYPESRRPSVSGSDRGLPSGRLTPPPAPQDFPLPIDPFNKGGEDIPDTDPNPRKPSVDSDSDSVYCLCQESLSDSEYLSFDEEDK